MVIIILLGILHSKGYKIDHRESGEHGKHRENFKICTIIMVG